MKKGLVLEGGAMRGLFTAGIIDVLMEKSIEIDGIVGVSAGAAFGCNYKSRQTGRAIRYNLKFARDIRYSGLLSLIFTGNYYNKWFCYGVVPEKLDIFDKKTFNENPVEFYVVATNVETGDAVYKRLDICDEDCFEWIRASASMPLVSKIVEVGGFKLLDGGIADSIPLKFAERVGFEKTIVILTQPRDYMKKPNNLVPLMKKVFKNYPDFVSTMENRHKIYNETLNYIREKEKEGFILVLSPDEPLPVSRVEHSRKKLLATYKIGRNVAYKNIDKIKEFLKEEV